MNLEKLKPWNWFKHEDGSKEQQVPVTRNEAGTTGRAPSLYSNTALDPLMRFQQELDRWFGISAHQFSPVFGNYRAMLDISADNDQYEITVDVPGLSKPDITIDVSNGVLTIRGSKEQETEDSGKHYYRVERSYGAFQRTLSLPDDADEDAIRASLKDGVLRLVIPRKNLETSEARKIEIDG